MSYLNFIDTEKILFYFDHIRDGWNEYIFNSKFCRQKIRFTAEEETNYVADLLNYFDDTIHLLTKFRANDNYRSALYDNIAVLQLMYIQQDLITELFQIFQIEKVEEENIIRFLRNELIGHPISRDKKGKLRSSVFITRQTQLSTLQYICYHKNNGYKFELKTYQWSDLFAKHEQYLLSHFDLLLKKIDEVLLSFKNALSILHSSIDNVPLIELVEAVENTYEQYHKNYPPYSVENILYSISKVGRHPRYELTNKIYTEGLNDSILEFSRFIEEFIQRKFVREVDKPKPPKVNVVFSCKENQPNFNNSNEAVLIITGNKETQSRSYHYEFSKLHDPNHPFGISFFEREFANDPEIIAELQNMKEPKSADFNISYEYLRLLLKQRGLLN